MESIALDVPANILKKNTQVFRAKTLPNQLLYYFLLSGMFENLQLLEAIDLVNVHEGIPLSVSGSLWSNQRAVGARCQHARSRQ